MSQLTEDIRRELQDLCLEHEEISAEERIERLEILLKDHPEAQDEYCRLVLLDRLLKTEFNVDGVSFSPLLTGTPQPTNTPTSSPVKTADASSGTRKWQFGLIAASLAAAIAFLMPSLLTPSLLAPSGDGEAVSATHSNRRSGASITASQSRNDWDAASGHANQLGQTGRERVCVARRPHA